MRIGNDVVIEGMATIENLPISNSSLSAIVQTDGNLFKRELGTISTASKESYIPGLSVAFPSIFNLNTESLDYNNRSLVVSLKNQLQGTALMAPVSMNGTPQFRRMLKSDLTDASVLFSDDPRIANWNTAYNRGDFRDFGLGRLMSRNKSVDTMSELESGLYGSISSDSGSPVPGSTGAFLHMRSATSGNTNWTQLYLLGNNAAEPRAFISHGSDTRKANWRELWTTGNLPDVVTEVSILGSSNYGMRFTTSNNLSNSELVQTYLGTKVIDSRSTQSSLPANGANYVPKTQEIPNSTSFSYFHYINGRYYTSLIFKGWANDYASWKISGWAEGASTDAMRDFYLSHTIADGSWGPNYKIWHSGNLVNPATQEWVNSLGFSTTDTRYTAGQHLSLTDNNAFVLIPRVNSWVTDSEGNQRIYFGNDVGSSTSMAFKLSSTGTNLSKFVFRNKENGAIVDILENGQITSKRDGNSSQWNQSYLWGNHADAGYSTQNLTAGTNIQISANNVISATNTTYSAGTLALLNLGIDTANRVWKTRDLADFVISKIAEGADSIWEHTSQGGLRIRDYDSLATREGAIAITKGGGATKINAIGIGTSVNSDGNDGLVIGPLSSNLGAYGTVVGPYSSNTPMEGTVVGAFLLNNQRGCVVSGRYNDPILSTTTNTITDESPLFIIGNGKSASIRSNAYVMKSNGKGEFVGVQSYKTQPTFFDDLDIPNWKYIQDNLSVDGNGSEDWVSNYGSQISVFDEVKASEELERSPYNSSGEILSNQEVINFDKPNLVYLSSSGAWRKWDDSGNYENTFLTQSSALGIAVTKDTVLVKGYYPRGLSKELDDLLDGLETGQIFHCISKGFLHFSEYTGTVERVFGYTVNGRVAYFNPWMFK